MSAQSEKYNYPETNRQVAAQIFVMEVGLRELIIEELSKVDGVRWYKTLLPTDVYQKYLRGRQTEKASTWTNHIDHHPLYYIDFPDLAKVLEKNWKQVFQDLFSDKAVFTSGLRSLEPIRNKCAHNRKLTDADVKIVSGVFTSFESAIGAQRLNTLVEKCSQASTVLESISLLREEVELAHETINSLGEPFPLVHWPAIRDEWWFDSSFLTGENHASKLELEEQKLTELSKIHELQKRKVEKLKELPQHKPTKENDFLSPIVLSFELFQEYVQLPRGRGSGHNLESWRDEKDLGSAFDQAKEAFSNVTSENSNE